MSTEYYSLDADGDTCSASAVNIVHVQVVKGSAAPFKTSHQVACNVHRKTCATQEKRYFATCSSVVTLCIHQLCQGVQLFRYIGAAYMYLPNLYISAMLVPLIHHSCCAIMQLLVMRLLLVCKHCTQVHRCVLKLYQT